MDQWILSRLESLKANIATEMEQYQLYNVVPALFDFIEDLTNWYIRLNRSRFWAEGDNADKLNAYETLYTTIYELSVSMAPFAPFLSETIYQALKEYAPESLPDSVHLCSYPEANTSRIKPLLEQAVTRMQHIILLGRQKRNQEKVKTKYPVASLTVIHRDTALLDEIARLEDYIKTELNAKAVEYSTDEKSYIHLYAKPNAPVLGKRLGKRFKDYRQLIETMDSTMIDELQTSGEIALGDEKFSVDDVLIYREAKAGTNAVSDRFVSIDMDCTLTDELINEGLAREVVNRIQKSRKDSGFNVSDRIRLNVNASENLKQAIETHEDYILKETLCTQLDYSSDAQDLAFEIDDDKLEISLSVVE